MRWVLSNTVTAGLATLAAALVVATVLSYRSILTLLDNARRVAHTHQVIAEIKNIRSCIRAAESAQGRLLLTSRPEHLEPRTEALSGLRAAVAGFRRLTADNPLQRHRGFELEAAAEGCVRELDAVLDASRTRGRDAAVAVMETDTGRRQMLRVRDLTADMLAEEGRLLQVRDAANTRASATVLGTIAVAGLAGAVLVALVAWLTARDAERRQASAEAIAREREWFRVTLQSLGEGLLVSDAQGRVRFLNPRGEEMTGWSQGEAVGRPVAEVFRVLSEDEGRPGEDLVGRVLAEAAVVRPTGRMVLEARDGTRRPVDESAAPVRDAEGRLIGAVLNFRDWTERRAAARERERLLEAERRARADAENANRLKDEFLSILSHELRTPLNAISGWVQLLKLGGLPPDEVRHGVEVIERNTKAQTKLINDLLDVSRIVSGRLRLEVRPVDLPKVVAAAAETVRPAADAKGVELSVDPEALPAPVPCDPDRVQQVVWNLLANAVKFTPSGGRVELRLTRTDGTARITVSDNGQGIPPEFLPHVFEPFRQADAGITRRQGGLGLGLGIVKRLVEAHGGTVAAESGGPGLGAVFRVDLPIRAVRPEPADPAAGATSAGTPGPEAPAADMDLGGLRVLVVDDEPDARDVVGRALSRRGAGVEAAGDAAEAFEKLRSARPDVLVSDIAMPGEDGYALIRRVRGLPGAEGSVPAVALTAFARDEDRARALEAGYQAHVAKPVDAGQLAVTVGRLAGRNPPGPPRPTAR